MTTTLVRVPRPRRRGAIPRLPRPGGLQGLARRPIPIDGLARMVRKHIAETVQVFEKRAMGKLERSGLLADLHRAAQQDESGKRYTKEIVGQMGAPLGEERARRIQRVLNTKEIEAIGRLFGTEADNWRLELETILKQDYLTLYNAGGRGARLKLRVSGSFNVRNPLILDALAERANLISGISESVFDRLLTTIAEQGFVFGKSPVDVGRALEDEFDFLSTTRARRIAHQEVLTITEQAETTLWEASGVEFKRWLTTLDGLERPEHFDLHGQIKRLEDPFEVNGIEIMEPGDPAAPPRMTMGCRCAKIPIVTTDQIFSDANVWRGDVDPDEFSKERLAAETA